MPDYAALARTAAPARPSLGERVRQLRIARGLTQTDLAGDRFSKEYVSQIERGKTRPTAETVEWLAGRLGVDASFLEIGVSSSERERVESVIARAEAHIEAGAYDETVAELAEVEPALQTVAAPELELRALLAESWARMYRGEIRQAVKLLDRARGLAEGASFTDVDRAQVLYHLACCRFKLNSISTASALYTQALELAERSALPADRLRSHIYEWRSRCYQRQRDWHAAREDAERALELAEGLNDRHTMGHVYFQYSLIAERTGNWVLARSYAEKAKAIYEEFRDQSNVGKLLNEIGALNFQLGKPDEAVKYLKEAFKVLIDAGDDTDAARVISSLAQVHLRTGKVELAEEQSRKALDMLGGRVDHLDEIGNAQLVLGRALLEQERLDEAEELFAAAESSFDQLSSASHRAAAWIAQGDLAARRGDDRRASKLYRRAAEALQDFHF
ncbi:MAG TPA: tetratricopeptide repeat protein [Gaiellaceae bacterium]|nr:tetratricopeptide repeat protein [Gaiellaceae bacterium]